MKRIKWCLDTGFGECYEGEFKVTDDMTDDEIEQMAREEALSCIDWGWEEVEADTKISDGHMLFDE